MASSRNHPEHRPGLNECCGLTLGKVEGCSVLVSHCIIDIFRRVSCLVRVIWQLTVCLSLWDSFASSSIFVHCFVSRSVYVQPSLFLLLLQLVRSNHTEPRRQRVSYHIIKVCYFVEQSVGLLSNRLSNGDSANSLCPFDQSNTDWLI